MGVIILLIVASLLVSSVFLLAFLWATRNGQYEDVDTPAIRMVFDEATPSPSESSISTHSTFNSSSERYP
jgi:cbb3-type cytochrome oxidase maturation protein